MGIHNGMMEMTHAGHPFSAKGLGFGNRLLASGSLVLQRLLAFSGNGTLLQESPVTVAGPLRNRTAFRVSRNRQLAALIPRPEASVNNEGHFFEGPFPADCKAGACVRDKACEDAATYFIAGWRKMVRRERGRAKE
jgi:hypothetical protein